MEMHLSCCCGCQQKWTPDDETERRFRFPDCGVQLLNNPLRDRFGGSMKVPLDVLPTAALPLSGGSDSLGFGTYGPGIGYYNINSNSVRVHRFLNWGSVLADYNFQDPPELELDDLWDIEGQSSLGSPPAPADRLNLHWNGQKGRCSARSTSHPDAHGSGTTIGVTADSVHGSEFTVAWDRVPAYPGHFVWNRRKCFHTRHRIVMPNGTTAEVSTDKIPVWVYYNDMVSYNPVNIPDVPKDAWEGEPVPIIPPVHMHVEDAVNGVPTTENKASPHYLHVQNRLNPARSFSGQPSSFWNGNYSAIIGRTFGEVFYPRGVSGFLDGEFTHYGQQLTKQGELRVNARVQQTLTVRDEVVRLEFMGRTGWAHDGDATFPITDTPAFGPPASLWHWDTALARYYFWVDYSDDLDFLIAPVGQASYTHVEYANFDDPPAEGTEEAITPKTDAQVNYAPTHTRKRRASGQFQRPMYLGTYSSTFRIHKVNKGSNAWQLYKPPTVNDRNEWTEEFETAAHVSVNPDHVDFVPNSTFRKKPPFAGVMEPEDGGAVAVDTAKCFPHHKVDPANGHVIQTSGVPQDGELQSVALPGGAFERYEI